VNKLNELVYAMIDKIQSASGCNDYKKLEVKAIILDSWPEIIETALIDSEALSQEALQDSLSSIRPGQFVLVSADSNAGKSAPSGI